MNNRINRIKDLLARSLDHELDPKEQIELKHALDNTPGLKETQKELLNNRDMLANQQFAFQPFFASKVMQKIQETARSGKEFFSDMYYAFLRISIPALAACIVLFLMIWYNEGNLTVETLTGVSNLSFDELLNEMFVYNEY